MKTIGTIVAAMLALAPSASATNVIEVVSCGGFNDPGATPSTTYSATFTCPIPNTGTIIAAYWAYDFSYSVSGTAAATIDATATYDFMTTGTLQFLSDTVLADGGLSPTTFYSDDEGGPPVADPSLPPGLYYLDIYETLNIGSIAFITYTASYTGTVGLGDVVTLYDPFYLVLTVKAPEPSLFLPVGSLLLALTVFVRQREAACK